MYSNLRLVSICFLYLLVFPVVSAVDNQQPIGQEINILIDVSGSMKQNDANNLRIPAVKLLINLLPNGTKAGIWLFAEKTSVLVDVQKVDEQWKKKALAKIKKIHSRGLFTNIEDAIQSSSQQWFVSKSQQNRSLILLTDGMVDVSKDIMLSAESRERILTEQISLLQQAEVNVQTIALSEDADIELLQKLAFKTNGWFEMSKSAAELQKVFFRMFKKAVPQDTLPISGNSFVVDKGIKEFSVVVFKKPGATETQLFSPKKIKINRSKKMKELAWVAEKNYDLITIKSPDAGEWKIVAELDPDNQVMIVTDLKFHVNELSNHLNENESIDLMAHFTEQQQLIDRNDFLKLIDILVEHTDAKGKKNSYRMTPVAGNLGQFSKAINQGLANGKHTIKIIADGQTFQREYVQTIEVVTSPIRVETKANNAERSVKLKLIVNENIINPEMMTVQAEINQKNRATENIELERSNGYWEMDVSAARKGKNKIINFLIMAQTIQGIPISPDIKPIIIDDSFFVSPKLAPDLKVTEETDKSEAEEIKEVNPEQADAETEEDEAEELEAPINWMKTVGIVVVINIILLVIGFFVLKALKKRAAEKQAKLLDRLA